LECTTGNYAEVGANLRAGTYSRTVQHDWLNYYLFDSITRLIQLAVA